MIHLLFATNSLGSQMKLFLTGCMLAGSFLASSQNFRAHLRQLDSVYSIQSQQADKRIETFLKNNKASKISLRNDGSVMVLVDISSSGVPIYIKSFNSGVATSLGVDQLRNSGTLGLNLEGLGIKVGIWDEGRVRNDHIELLGRVTQIDNPSAFVTHSTHVMGTILGTGINANAKGMAPKATALAFDFMSDVSEMLSQAEPDQTSLILSNHSYGTVSGWDLDGTQWTWFGDPGISQTKDWKFGFYNSTSNLYDDIAYNAPYYLIVKAAGNDANDTGDGSRPQDCDPFDCIPTNGVAKNILTVGAVKKLAGAYTGPADVEITAFSSLGPADDGRIKPDLVAPGQSVLSLSSNSTGAYTTLSGTSMSTPATTGTLALLQELHKNLNGGNLMKSATLKALAIHTTREAGPSSGPDYKFGWGLLDAEAAAKILIDRDDQNVFVKELSLNSGDVFEMELTPKENTKITATLVWTDPAGPVLAPSLNPTTKMLRNDLDLRLVDDGGTMQFPWKLNSASPSVAATRGDNVVDNIEKLEFENPEPRNYKLRVTHKGALVNGKQDFSLILNYTSVVDPRVSYYWIGNTGDWDDGANWSLSSGGAPASVVPGSDDKVVFDENSFSADNQTVTLTQDQECYALRWFANELTNLSFDNHQLTVRDEINLLSNNIASTSTGTILLTGTTTTDAIINLSDNNLDDLILKFMGQESKWNLSGNFNIDAVEIVEGNVTIGDGNIQLNTLSSSGTGTKNLFLDETSISGLTGLSFDVSGVTLSANNTQMVASAPLVYSVDLGTNDFDGTFNLQGGEVNVGGSGAVDKVVGNGILNITGNHTWNSLTLNEGSVLTIAESSVQKIVDAFFLQATSGNRVAVESSGTGLATLDFEIHQKICLDNLDIENVTVTGQATLNAGSNSNLINSPNWFQDDCANILFPDFDIEFNCENAAVFFIDKSSGPVTNRNWDFGDVGSLSNESTLTNPVHLFSAGNQFTVTLTVSNGTATESFSKPVELNSTLLLENKVELSNGKLISFLPANKYQWVLNGELLDDTNLRSIDFSGSEGLYAVLTFDDNCNRQSETFLVTGLEESFGQQSIQVYPNPTQGEVFVIGDEINDVQVVNSVGQIIAAEKDKVEGGWRLKVSNSPKGIYLLQVKTETRVDYKRIIVR